MREFVAETRVNPGLYGKNNRPASVEVAQRRLQSINAELGDVEAQLTYTNPDLYPNVERFNDWKRRATRAVGIYRAERSFLERWISHEENKDLPANVIAARKEAAMFALQIFVDEQVRNLSAKYQPLYGLNAPEPTNQQALTRHAELNSVWNECAAVFLELRSRGDAARASDKQMERIRKPLGTINHRIQTEMAFLNNLLSISPHLRPRFDKIGFLLTVLERAKAEGFVLTTDEEISLKALIRDRDAVFKRMQK